MTPIGMNYWECRGVAYLHVLETNRHCLKEAL
jgi:hypothetical protein